MQKIYRQKRNYKAASLGDDDVGKQFAEWLTGQVIEGYAYKVAEYCNAIKNCSNCQFFNGTCRLKDRPFSWDMKPY